MRRFIYPAMLGFAMVALLAACSGPTPTPTTIVIPTTTATTLAATTAATAGAESQTSATAPATAATTSAGGNTGSGAAQLTPGNSGVVAPESSTGGTTNRGQQPGSSIGALASPTNGAAGNTGSAAATAAGGTQAPTLSGTAAANQANQLDPCALVTRLDAEAALGMQVQSPQPTTDQNGIRTCQYVVPSTTTPITIGITVYQGGSQLDVVRNLIAGGQPVDGLGMAVTQVNTGLFIQVGNNAYVGIAASIPGQQDQANNVQRVLAQQAISRLTAKPTPAG